MATKRAEAKVYIVGDAKGFSVAMRKATWEAQTFQQKMMVVGGQLTKIGRTMTLGVTLPIVAGLALATKAAADEGKEMALLANALRKNTGATKEQVAAVETWVTKMQNATGVADGELRPALSTLLTVTKDVGKAQQIMGVALDISAAKGKPVETVATALMKAYNGNVGALGRLGIATKDASGKTLTFDQVMKNAKDTFGGSAAKAAATTAGKMAILKAQVADLAENIGGVLLPVLTKIVGYLTPLVDRFNGLSDSWKQTIVVVGLVVAAVGPLLLVVGKLMTTFPLIVGGIKAVGTALMFLAANPVGLIIVAVAALIAGLILLYKHNETFRNIVQAVARVLQTVVVGAFKVLGAIIQWVIKHWRGLMQAFLIAAGPIGWVALYIIKNFQKVKDTLATVWGWLKSAWKKVYEYWQDTPMGKVTGAIIDAFQNLKDRAGEIWSGILGTIAGFVNKIGSVINTVFGPLGVHVKEWNPGAKPDAGKPIASHATGALVKRPELALIGEDGPELILPLTKPERMKKLLAQIGIKASSQPITGMTALGQKEPRYGGIRAYAQGGIVGAAGDLWGRVKDLFGGISIPKLPEMLSGLLPAVVEAVMKKVKDVIGSGSGKRAQIVKNAVEHVGAPYVFGATGPGSFDCSGLIYHAYNQAGMSIPRIPVYGGKVIGAGDMQPADVLLYNPNALQNGVRVPFGHYRMYAGGGRTIESGGGGVHMDSLMANPPSQVRSYIYDRGGWLPPGTSLATNNTGSPEFVGGGGETTINVNVVVPGGTTLIGSAAQVGSILAPHVARALGQAAARQGRRR